LLDFRTLNPVQSMAAGIFFQKKRLLLVLPRQFGGKTELGVRLLHDLTRRPMPSSCLFLAKDQPSGKKATREKFMRIFDPKLFNVNTEQVSLKACPTSVIFKASVDRDPDRNRGGTYSMIHWSEVAFSKIEKGESITSTFDKIFQPTLARREGYAFLETTLNGKNGFYDLWNNYEMYGFSRLKLGLSDYVYMGLLSSTEYDKIQSTTHPDVFEQEFECQFISFQGRAFPEFDKDRHVQSFDGPAEWQTTVAAIDWGYHPSATCVLFAYVRDGITYIYDEHWKLEELAVHTADEIDARKQKWQIGKMLCVADHDLARIEELNRRKIACGQAKKTNIMGALIQIKEMFYFDTLRVHPRCTHLIRELESATWEPKKGEDIDYSSISQGHGDAIATLRYLVRELSGHEPARALESPHLDTANTRQFEILNAVRGKYYVEKE